MDEFQKLVIDYYSQSGRHDLPWRLDVSTYSIVISEVMLQQTQVSRVIPKYQAWMADFPDWQALAGASNYQILTAWQGLGYNRRGLWLAQTGKTVADQYDGELPNDPADLVKLPGIGPNTAGSIAAFAFNVPVVFVETNIRRVFIHHFFEDQEGIDDSQLRPLIEKSLSDQQPRIWYWALMDYGSHLATQLPNPNRRSKHYAKQSKFQGSARQIRGEVLRQLLADSKSLDQLQLQIKDDRLIKVLSDLMTEGMIALDSDNYQIK